MSVASVRPSPPTHAKLRMQSIYKCSVVKFARAFHPFFPNLRGVVGKAQGRGFLVDSTNESQREYTRPPHRTHHTKRTGWAQKFIPFCSRHQRSARQQHAALLHMRHGASRPVAVLRWPALPSTQFYCTVCLVPEGNEP